VDNDQQQMSKRDVAKKTVPAQNAQETRWASPRRQRPPPPQQAAYHVSSSSLSSTTNDVTVEPQYLHSQQSPGDRVPAEKESLPTKSGGDDDTGRCGEKDADVVVTKNGYIRVVRVVGKSLAAYRNEICV